MNRTTALLLVLFLTLSCAASAPTVRFRKIVEKIEILGEISAVLAGLNRMLEDSKSKHIVIKVAD